MSVISPMSKAKAQMLMKHVFFASVLVATKVIEDKTCPTAWTDGIVIGYNPHFIDGLKDPQLVMFVMGHEVLHIILKHPLRRGTRDPKKWNIACDHAVNIMLKKAGFTIWQYAYCDMAYDNMSAEQIYALLPDPPAGGQGGGIGDDLNDPPGDMDEVQKKEIERKIDRVVAQAASMARMAGKLSADLDRMVSGVLNPPQPWQELLREFATQGFTNEETWNRRNRRVPHVYLPSLARGCMGECVLIGDTSGSITDKELVQIGGESCEIMDSMRPERLRVIWWDMHLKNEEVFEPGDDVVLHPKGGGGTDMVAALEYAAQFDPVVVILITDGHTPWPREEPPFPLIVCCSTQAPVPIGQVVRLNP